MQYSFQNLSTIIGIGEDTLPEVRGWYVVKDVRGHYATSYFSPLGNVYKVKFIKNYTHYQTITQPQD